MTWQNGNQLKTQGKTILKYWLCPDLMSSSTITWGIWVDVCTFYIFSLPKKSTCRNPNLSALRKSQRDGLTHGVILVSQYKSQIATLWMRWLVRARSTTASFTQSIMALHMAVCRGARGTLTAPSGQSVVMSIKTGTRRCGAFPRQAAYLLFMSVFGNVAADWLIGLSTREELSLDRNAF